MTPEKYTFEEMSSLTGIGEETLRALAKKVASKEKNNFDKQNRAELSKYNLTPKRLRVLNLLIEHIQDTGITPTVREIGEALGVTHVTIQEHLNNLKEAGYINRSNYRTIDILRLPPNKY